jgi:hypothetical protein
MNCVTKAVSELSARDLIDLINVINVGAQITRATVKTAYDTIRSQAFVDKLLIEIVTDIVAKKMESSKVTAPSVEDKKPEPVVAKPTPTPVVVPAVTPVPPAPVPVAKAVPKAQETKIPTKQPVPATSPAKKQPVWGAMAAVISSAEEDEETKVVPPVVQPSAQPSTNIAIDTDDKGFIPVTGKGKKKLEPETVQDEKKTSPASSANTQLSKKTDSIFTTKFVFKTKEDENGKKIPIYMYDIGTSNVRELVKKNIGKPCKYKECACLEEHNVLDNKCWLSAFADNTSHTLCTAECCYKGSFNRNTPKTFTCCLHDRYHEHQKSNGKIVSKNCYLYGSLNKSFFTFDTKCEQINDYIAHVLDVSEHFKNYTYNIEYTDDNVGYTTEPAASEDA